MEVSNGESINGLTTSNKQELLFMLESKKRYHWGWGVFSILGFIGILILILIGVCIGYANSNIESNINQFLLLHKIDIVKYDSWKRNLITSKQIVPPKISELVISAIVFFVIFAVVCVVLIILLAVIGVHASNKNS